MLPTPGLVKRKRGRPAKNEVGGTNQRQGEKLTAQQQVSSKQEESLSEFEDIEEGHEDDESSIAPSNIEQSVEVKRNGAQTLHKGVKPQGGGNGRGGGQGNLSSENEAEEDDDDQESEGAYGFDEESNEVGIH